MSDTLGQGLQDLRGESVTNSVLAGVCPVYARPLFVSVKVPKSLPQPTL